MVSMSWQMCLETSVLDSGHKGSCMGGHYTCHRRLSHRRVSYFPMTASAVCGALFPKPPREKPWVLIAVRLFQSPGCDSPKMYPLPSVCLLRTIVCLSVKWNQWHKWRLQDKPLNTDGCNQNAYQENPKTWFCDHVSPWSQIGRQRTLG